MASPKTPHLASPDLVVAIASEDARLTESLEQICRGAGQIVVATESLEGLDHSLDAQDVDIVLLDADLLARGGKRTLRQLASREDPAPILLVASETAPQSGYDLVARGVRDVVQRPPHPTELHLRINQAVDTRDLELHLANLEEEITERSRKSFNARALVNRSPAMHDLSETLQRVSKLRTTVLIRGESGVGKELAARALHFNSPRREAPFIAINCAAMAPHLIESELFGHERGAFTGAVSRRAGKFELAHRGTLFLDEVAETDLPTQAKLLRILEQHEFMRVGGSRPVRVEVRLVAATNADLEALVREGRFREDLYYRLKVVTLVVPPLRDRREDIPELVETFLGRICKQNQLRPRRVTASALAALCRYPWPGNVRELMNTLEAVVVATPSETIDVEGLPTTVQSMTTVPKFSPRQLAGRTLKDIEADAIRATLAAVSGSRTEAAKLLGIGLRTLRRRIRDLELSEELPPRPGRPRRTRQ
ncbi:MAG: sigma-54 dependent transcriptional regulator [Acidobacteriota bacterium]|nr:sigma-54 dependent transcriptional regulator [Acidobacteriota bacterium]